VAWREKQEKSAGRNQHAPVPGTAGEARLCLCVGCTATPELTNGMRASGLCRLRVWRSFMRRQHLLISKRWHCYWHVRRRAGGPRRQQRRNQIAERWYSDAWQAGGGRRRASKTWRQAAIGAAAHRVTWRHKAAPAAALAVRRQRGAAENQ